MSIQNASLLLPKYEIDKIFLSTIFTMSGTSENFGYGVTGDAMVVGIYSKDGGTTWDDFHQSSLPGGFTITEGGLDAYQLASPGQVNFFTGSAGTLVRFAVIDIPGVTNPNITSTSFSGNTLYQSSRSYMKIALQGNYTRTASSPETRTIAHNLGYVPMCIAYVKDNITSAGVSTRVQGANFGLPGTINYALRADSTNIYISTPTYTPTQDITIYYKVYYEN